MVKQKMRIHSHLQEIGFLLIIFLNFSNLFFHFFNYKLIVKWNSCHIVNDYQFHIVVTISSYLSIRYKIFWIILINISL
jgi:hypothetical protein